MKPRPSLRETDTGISISHVWGGGDDDGDKDDSEWHSLYVKHVLFLIILTAILRHKESLFYK